MTDDTLGPPDSEGAQHRYSPGDLIVGKYKLNRILGEGGMGEVWEARNLGLDLLVAIKLIRSDVREDSAGARLVQEARAAAQLGHPAIVRVFDVGETRFSDPFIVMELLRGDNLGDVLAAEGRLSAVAATQILLPIADALATAHLKGIVHRDIKPENIYLAEDEAGVLQPKLVDFGVAKLENTELDSKLTTRGTIVGSPGYLAPEQARGLDNADYRVDIWAFAVVLYELVTGVPPFSGGNYNALLRSIVEDNPKPITEQAAGDAELWSMVERGLRKAPEERWPSMLEFGRALAHWAFAQGVDEDVCGTGLEAKWLEHRQPGRGSLLSVNFDETESPSTIRRRRRSRWEVSSPSSNAPTAAEQPTDFPPGPDPLPLPSPARQEEAQGSDSSRVFADTEIDSRPAPPKKGRRTWTVVAILTVLFGLSAALAFSASESGSNAATVPPTPPMAKPGNELESVESTPVAIPPDHSADLPTMLPGGQPEVERHTNPRMVSDASKDADDTSGTKSIRGKAPESAQNPPAKAKAKAPATRTVQSSTPKKNEEKALTQKREPPKLDLKKPY